MSLTACLLWGLTLPALAASVLPPGAHLEIRLKTKVASNSSKPGDPVEALLIQPVLIAGSTVVPAGTPLSGQVKKATPIGQSDPRASLELEFSKLGDAAIQAKLVQVDDARETVDDNGRIVGILSSETLSARLDQEVDRVSKRFSRLGSFLEAAKSLALEEPAPEIVYDPGVEMTLALTQAVEWKGPPAPALPAVSPEDALYSLVNAEPWRTVTQAQSTPSDITNLMFLASEQQLTAAFEAAGWATAAKLNTISRFQVIRAVADSRGYNEAPVSVLLLEGRPPDLVFEKQNNTFAKRHHLRIWRRPGDFQGRAIWVCAATHDTGINFSAPRREFIHRIDSQIDLERSKVAADLALTGRVKALSTVARPAAPQHSQNATGDNLETDGRMAVLLID